MKRTQLQERYELGQILGKGGMGVVYRAHDRLMQRDVALKTILDVDAVTTALFYNEWNLLATMVHPNIINIYDIGEFEHEGAKKPFFVMPLLPGVGLDQLIRENSPRLSVTGVLDVIEQACRGLHAAHLQGLVHRDVKPSNIFVMSDNSVKVIDFGIARVASDTKTSSIRGTGPYMAPELFEMKPPTPLSDIFALGVVTYQALAKARPFEGATESEIIDAIRHFIPPSISSVNRDVSLAVSQVVAKAMAKQPWHRFTNMREFGDSLQKALRNEPLEWLDNSKIKSRLERATKSFEEGDYVFVTEVLAELEAEGYLGPEITVLRARLNATSRQIRIGQLLESAQRFIDATEFALARRKVQEALELDPHDPKALALAAELEKAREKVRTPDQIVVARQHLENHAFGQAREALDSLLQKRPNDTEALGLLAEIGRQEQQVTRIRDEKSRIHQDAIEAWGKGDLTSAMNQMEILIGMDRENPEADPGRSAVYRSFYDQVRSENDDVKNAYEEARRSLAASNFGAALGVSQQYLSKYPNHALFQALQFDVEAALRQRVDVAISETLGRVQAEPDLNRQMAILLEALNHYPGEPSIEAALGSVHDKKELVDSLVAKARGLEKRGQLNEALAQWQTLKSIYDLPEYSSEISSLTERRDRQARENSRTRLVQETNKHLESGDYIRAMQSVQAVLAEFPGEPALQELEMLVRRKQEENRRALGLLAAAQASATNRDPDRSIQLLREANQTDPHSTVIRTVMVNMLLDRGNNLVSSDPRAAEELAGEALRLEPGSAPAQALKRLVAERKAPAVSPDFSDTKTMPVVTPPLAKIPAPPVKAAPEPVPELPRAPREPVPLEQQPKPRPPAPGLVRKLLYGLITVLTVLLVVALLTLFKQHEEPPVVAKPAQYRVSLIASALGAEIKLNGESCGTSQCDVTVGAGEYKVEANLSGFLPATATFKATEQKGPPPAIELVLVPAPSPLSISTDLPNGPVLVDGAPAGQIQAGGAELSALPAGRHDVSVQSGDYSASFTIDVPAGTAVGVIPRLINRSSTPIHAKGVRAFVLAESGAGARLYGSEARTKVLLDGRPLGDLAPEGLEIKVISMGPHELTLDGGPGQQDKMVFESKSSVAVYAKVMRLRRVKP